MEVGVQPFLKINFTLESLLNFQTAHDMHVEMEPGKEKVPDESRHKRPNYNNQQRRLLAKGRQHQEQLVSKSYRSRAACFKLDLWFLFSMQASFNIFQVCLVLLCSALQGRVPVVLTQLA